MDNSSYNLKVFCSNCDFEGEVKIPQGTKVDNHPCPKCGNKSLGKIQKPARIIPRHESYR